MACLIDPVIINRKYVKIAEENNEDVDQYSNREDYYVHVPCGRCINCISSYMTMWRNRLMLEYEYMSCDARDNSYFITLTFRDAVLNLRDFDLSTIKRRFIDRIRKKAGSSPRHWLITEYGENTFRLHLHGIFFDVNFDIWNLEDYWQHGFVDFQQLTEGHIKYCTSYVTKGVADIIIPPERVQRVFCSPGIGKAYCDDPYNVRYHHPAPGVLHPTMQNSSGFAQAMPRYFKQKIFNDFEREDMTLQYFHEQSDDVIPDPPYKIGKRVFTDYTLYLSALEEHRKSYRRLYPYKKQKFNGK